MSFSFKKTDRMDQLIGHKLTKMVEGRADLMAALRKKPVLVLESAQDYDLTFLITSELLETYSKKRLIAAILDALTTVERDLVATKINLTAQIRIASRHFLESLTRGPPELSRGPHEQSRGPV